MTECTTPNLPNAKAKRRLKASDQWIESMVALGQRRGLQVTGITHHSDGSCTVEFGDVVRRKAKGWKV